MSYMETQCFCSLVLPMSVHDNWGLICTKKKKYSHALVLMKLRRILSVWYYFKFNPKLYVLSGLWHFSQIQFLQFFRFSKWEREKKSRVTAMKRKFMIFYWICFGALAAPTTWRLHHFVFSFLSFALSQYFYIFVCR